MKPRSAQAQPVRQKTKDHPEFAVLYTLGGSNNHKADEFLDLESCLQNAAENIRNSQAQVLFLKGYPSPLWVSSGSAGVGSGERGASPFSPVTTPGTRDSATPCQDLDPAELGSSAVASTLGVLDENWPLVLIPNSKSDIFETQQWRSTGGEGDGRTGNASPYEHDVVAVSLVAEIPVNALSDKEEESEGVLTGINLHA